MCVFFLLGIELFHVSSDHCRSPGLFAIMRALILQLQSTMKPRKGIYIAVALSIVTISVHKM